MHSAAQHRGDPRVPFDTSDRCDKYAIAIGDRHRVKYEITTQSYVHVAHIQVATPGEQVRRLRKNYFSLKGVAPISLEQENDRQQGQPNRRGDETE